MILKKNKKTKGSMYINVWWTLKYVACSQNDSNILTVVGGRGRERACVEATEVLPPLPARGMDTELPLVPPLPPFPAGV